MLQLNQAPQTSTEFVQLLTRISTGDRLAEEDLMRSVYEELRSLATWHLRRERPDHHLQATDLVHEVYLRIHSRHSGGWVNRAHYLATAARIMRQILTDVARARQAHKRGSGCAHFRLEDCLLACQDTTGIHDLSRVLSRLAAFAPRSAEVVKLKFFEGLTEDEIAIQLAVCSRTVKRDWTVAKAWLYEALSA